MPPSENPSDLRPDPPTGAHAPFRSPRRDGLRALLAPALLAATGAPREARAAAAPVPVTKADAEAAAAVVFRRPVRVLVPFGPGGIADITARAVAQKFEGVLGTPVVIENRPGAGGVSATSQAARAEPDGHTLFLMSNGTAVAAALFRSLPFDAVADFAPLGAIGSFGLAVVVRPEAPWRSLADLLAHARARPGDLNIGTIAIGSTQNLAAEWLRIRTRVDAQIVPFNGTPALITAVRAGHVDVGIEIVGPLVAQVGAGALRVLAVTSARRASGLPDVPTVIESGVQGFDVVSWNGLAVPARTPAPVRDRLAAALASVLSDPPLRARLAALGVEPADADAGTEPAAAVAAGRRAVQSMASLLAGDIVRWSTVVKEAGIARQ